MSRTYYKLDYKIDSGPIVWYFKIVGHLQSKPFIVWTCGSELMWVRGHQITSRCLESANTVCLCAVTKLLLGG